MGGFKLGDHEFLVPGGAAAPLSRLTQKNRSPIAGAEPPSFIAEVCREAELNGPVGALIDGSFCGHGEPTFSVFDLVVDGDPDVQLALPYEDNAEPAIMPRPGSAADDDGWSHMIRLHEHFDGFAFDGAGPSPQPVTDHDGNIVTLRAAIGFEYPPDATSVDDITWLAIALQLDDWVGVAFSMEIG